MKTIRDFREAWNYLFDWAEYIKDEAMDDILSDLSFLKLLIVDELNSGVKLGPKAEKKLIGIEKKLRNKKIWKKSVLE